MNVFDLIDEKMQKEKVETYIDFYFHNMVGLDLNKKIYFESFEKGFISIMKDEIDRKINGSGRFRDKAWSNFIFYFIKEDAFKETFGTNLKYRKITSISNNGDFSLSPFFFNDFAKKPNDIYLNRKNNLDLARILFNKLKDDKAFLFVRSYVYITIILYNDKQITENNYLTFYFNTNYKFTETNGKTNFIYNVKKTYLVEDLLHELSIIESNNRDVFDCVYAYEGTINHFNLTDHNLKNIKDFIENGEEYVLVEGAARTGKTIIAMNLLGIYKDSVLIVMNYYFYQSLKDAFVALNKEFPEKRIYHQARGKKGHYENMPHTSLDFLIIDECQRMGEKFGLVEKIISSNSHQHTVFLGDNYQRLRKSSDDGISYIQEKVVNAGKIITKIKFSDSVGIPPDILRNIRYLLGDPTITSPHFLGEYEIKIYDDKYEFLEEYENDSHKNRHLATIQCPYNNFSPIGKYLAFPKELVNSDYPYFLNSEIIEKYYLSPYELISREVESIYVYVRNEIDENNLKEFVFYQLYILMTRATVSLNIFCENNQLKNVLKNRLNEIKDYTSRMDHCIMDCIKEGQFEINESFHDDFCKSYSILSPKEIIKSRGITRLVHFTGSSNIESIIQNGLMPRKMLNENHIAYDYNDDNRLDGNVECVCLSVENPNQWLLMHFKNKFPYKKYKLITINPSILYLSFTNENESIHLTNRLYCDYNAASSGTRRSSDEMDLMFEENIQKYRWKYGPISFTRNGLPDNYPTANQAEILFAGRIPPEFIEEIEDI